MPSFPVIANQQSHFLHVSSRHNKSVVEANNANILVRYNNNHVTSHVSKIVPVYVSIPHLFHNVDQYHNKLIVDNQLYTIDEGNYTPQEFADAWESALIPANILFEYDNETFGFVLGLDAVTISQPNSFGALTMMGWDVDTFSAQPGPVPGLRVSAPNKPAMAPLTSIFVHSSRIGNGQSSSDGVETFIDVIDVTQVPYGGTISLQNMIGIYGRDIEFMTDTERLQEIDFQLKDQHHRQLYLPTNQHWEIVFKTYAHAP